MHRTQVYLDEAMEDRLREVARSQGRSAAAVVREAVAAYLTALRGAESRADSGALAALVGAFEGRHHDAAEHHDGYLYGPAGRTRA